MVAMVPSGVRSTSPGCQVCSVDKVAVGCGVEGVGVGGQLDELLVAGAFDQGGDGAGAGLAGVGVGGQYEVADVDVGDLLVL